MHVCACLLLYFSSMFVWLDLGSCHALCPLWVCACWPLGPLAVWLHPSLLWFVCMQPFVKNTSPWCGFAWCIPLSSLCVDMLAFLALCHPVWLPLFLWIFTRLFIYSYMRPYVGLLVSSILIPTISCGFIPVLEAWDPESFLVILLDGTRVVHTPILWNCGHLIQTYILSSIDSFFVW